MISLLPSLRPSPAVVRFGHNPADGEKLHDHSGGCCGGSHDHKHGDLSGISCTPSGHKHGPGCSHTIPGLIQLSSPPKKSIHGEAHDTDAASLDKTPVNTPNLASPTDASKPASLLAKPTEPSANKPSKVEAANKPGPDNRSWLRKCWDNVIGWFKEFISKGWTDLKTLLGISSKDKPSAKSKETPQQAPPAKKPHVHADGSVCHGDH